ncbi:MAG: hypothetical protein DELT_02100 [Desulfovibrio sp.]
MIALSVMVEIHPEFAEQYREAVLRHAKNCLTNEKGCLAFTVHVLPEAPNRFFLYEAYATEKDLKEIHTATQYLAEFKELTAPWTKNKEIALWRQLPS